MFSNNWAPNPLSNLFLKISWPLYVYTIYQGLSLFCHSLSLSSWLSNVCIFIFADYIFIMSTHKFYKISEIFIFFCILCNFLTGKCSVDVFFRIFPSLWREKKTLFWWWTSMESRKTENFLTTSGDLFRRIIWYICTKIQDVANLRVFSLIFFHVWFWSRRSLNFETLCIWFALTQRGSSQFSCLCSQQLSL